MARVLSVAALVLLGLGVVAGLVPVSARGTSCGSAFFPTEDAWIQDLTAAVTADMRGTGLRDPGGVQAACDDLLSVVRIPAVALIVVGVGLLVAGVVVGQRASGSK